MSARVSSSIGKAAERLLASLAERGARPHGGDAAEILIANDLVQRCADGMLEINAAGRAHLARRAFARAGTIDPFLGQHLGGCQGEIRTAEGRRSVAIDAAESPLAWLARRKSRAGRALISPEQLQSGERLRADFTRAQLMPRVTANWTSSVAQDRRSGARTATFTDAVLVARQRVRSALEAVGPEFTGLLLDVCCFLKGLEDIERERGWPSRSAKVVLQLGLDRLARHYGYAAEARGAARAAVRTWLAPDGEFVLGE
ncbi:MAG: DUF6456 domain-containing protein [Xanthobacteraceae bacterium]